MKPLSTVSGSTVGKMLAEGLKELVPNTSTQSCPRDCRQRKLSHEIAFVVFGYTVAAACTMAQRNLPPDTCLMIRGCVFYVSMVTSFKLVYDLVKSKILKPGKIIVPGQVAREQVPENMIPQHESVKGFVMAMLLRAVTFLSVSDGDSYVPLSLSLDEDTTRNTLFWWEGQALLLFATTLGRIFAWTLFYDLIYYWLHRFFHMRSIFKHVHAKHHSIAQPHRRVTLLHTVTEMVFEILVPTLVTQLCCGYFGWSLTVDELSLAYANVQIMEVLGHSGTAGHSSSFAYCPWLPEWLGIGLRIEDHDAHHADRLVNFSKQFSIWDKTFGTFQQGHLASRKEARASGTVCSKTRKACLRG